MVKIMNIQRHNLKKCNTKSCLLNLLNGVYGEFKKYVIKI